MSGATSRYDDDPAGVKTAAGRFQEESGREPTGGLMAQRYGPHTLASLLR
jgi:hypothetical protein